MQISISANVKRAATALLALTLIMTSASAFAYSINEPIDGPNSLAKGRAASDERVTGTAINLNGRFFEGIEGAYGGAVYSIFGWTDPNGHTPTASYVKASNSTFINNQAVRSDNTGRGGAIYASGYVNLSDSIFAGNRSNGYGGAIYTGDGNPESSGGAPLYYPELPESVIRNTSITDNHAEVAGGGIYTNGSLLLTADAGKSTIISGNTAAGRSDGIHMETSTSWWGTSNSSLTIDGAGTVQIDDSIRAEGRTAVEFNKNGSGSLIWGESNYFTNNSSLSFNEGNTTLSDNFSLQAENMSLNIAAEHSLYLDLTNRARDLIYFDGLSQLTVAAGSSLVLTFNDVLNLENELDLGSWLFADVLNVPLGSIFQVNNFEITILVDGHEYIGAFFELIGTDLWLNLAGLSAAAAATPIPASVLLLGTGVAALIRMRRRAA